MSCNSTQTVEDLEFQQRLFRACSKHCEITGFKNNPIKHVFVVAAMLQFPFGFVDVYDTTELIGFVRYHLPNIFDVPSSRRPRLGDSQT